MTTTKNMLLLTSILCAHALQASDREIELAMQKGNVSTAQMLKNNALLEAVGTGNISRVQMLITAGADINARNIFGFTVLWFAVSSNHTQITQMLLNVPGIAIDGAILHVAVENGNIATIQTLIAADANLDTVILGNTALEWAIAREQFAAAKELLRAGASLQTFTEVDLTRLKAKLEQEDQDLLEKAVADPCHQEGIREYQKLKRKMQSSRTSIVKALHNRELV